MCGRVIQSSGPVRYAIVDGMNVRDSRVHNYPPWCNATPSQELLVIRTFAIITTDANELIANIHDRMPVILPPTDHARWLGDEPDPRELMPPFPADLMRMWPIRAEEHYNMVAIT